jgi:hypothetical protein
MDCSLISQKGRGLTAKLVGIFWFQIYFPKENCESMAHELRVVLVHSGHRTEEAVVAHQSSFSRPVWATAAHRDVGKTKKSSSGFGSDLQRSLYGSEEAAR